MHLANGNRQWRMAWLIKTNGLVPEVKVNPTNNSYAYQIKLIYVYTIEYVGIQFVKAAEWNSNKHHLQI